MGAVCEKEAAVVASQKIDMELQRDRDKTARQKKLLLLGAGECGKSTILKQVRIMHDDNWQSENKEMQKRRIYSNIVMGAAELCAGVEKVDLFLTVELEQHYDILKGVLKEKRDMDPITEETKEALKDLWADPTVRRAYELRSRLQVADSISYYLNELERITQPNFEPTNQDLLHLRIPTRGIQEHRIMIKGSQFAFIDVGGQKSERKKWANHFHEVDSILFISAISEFDQKLVERTNENRLLDSMSLYREIVNMPVFEKSAIILFLNKTDLFREKIKTKSINSLFVGYHGPNTYEDSLKYIKSAFLACAPDKTVYSHYTCATDSNQVQLAIGSVIESIITNNLQKMGIS